MIRLFLTYCLLTACLFACSSGTKTPIQAEVTESFETPSQHTDSTVYASENLLIRKLSEQVYEHTSFLQTESFGKVACNGMVVMYEGQAVVFDTPADVESSRALIRYFTEETGGTITAVVATHFHADCVGGLAAFHEQQIPSHGSERTLKLLQEKGAAAEELPLHGFGDTLTLHAGGKEVLAVFFGEGHTRDNVIGYFPDEQVIFGGCLIKELGAGKGNLEDANVLAWPQTIRSIKQTYPHATLIIPGHGKRGGTELLDYTIQLFGGNTDSGR